jgi:NTP pyrophosphatase (non-canonical NTP hydrolase)
VRKTTETSIIEWSKSSLADRSISSRIVKLGEEMGELVSAINKNGLDPASDWDIKRAVIEEAADVAIVLTDMADSLGFSAVSALAQWDFMLGVDPLRAPFVLYPAMEPASKKKIVSAIRQNRAMELHQSIQRALRSYMSLMGLFVLVRTEDLLGFGVQNEAKRRIAFILYTMIEIITHLGTDFNCAALLKLEEVSSRYGKLSHE